MPTANPAKSKSFDLYVPGISAVSPPIKEHFDFIHPSVIPLIIFEWYLISNLDVAR